MEKEALGASREYEQVHPMPSAIRTSMQANHSTLALLSSTAQPTGEGKEEKASAEQSMAENLKDSMELKGRFMIISFILHYFILYCYLLIEIYFEEC